METKRRFDRISPFVWYAPLAKYTWFVITVLLFVFFTGQTLRNASRSSYTIKELISDIISTPASQLLKVTFILVIFGVVLVVLLQVIDRFFFFVFPTGVFALGLGKKRYENREILRTLVVIGLAVSLIGSLIVTFAFK